MIEIPERKASGHPLQVLLVVIWLFAVKIVCVTEWNGDDGTCLHAAPHEQKAYKKLRLTCKHVFIQKPEAVQGDS